MSRRVVLDAPRVHRIEDTTAPEPPGAGQAQVAVAAAGLCGSDHELWEGTRPADYVRYPLTPGHEWAGTVTAVGSGVDPALVGRRTVGEGFRNCQLCDRCREGATPLCAAGYDETGFTRPGAFAEYLTLPARLLHPLPDDADLEAAALLEPAAVVAGAVLRARPRPGERVAVVGAGTLGLLAVRYLSAYSPSALVALDPSSGARERAVDAGADAITPDDAPDGHFDLVVETAGAAGTASAAVRCARRGGRVVLTGIPGAGARGLDPAELVVRAVAVTPVFGAGPAAWSHAVSAFRTGALDPAALITHRFPLESYPDAVALAGGGRDDVGKVLLVP